MLATRALFLILTLIFWLMNGWSLGQVLGWLPTIPNLLIVTLITNIIIVPLTVWSAYRTGELVEEVYRTEEQQRLAAASTANSGSVQTRATNPVRNPTSDGLPKKSSQGEAN